MIDFAPQIRSAQPEDAAGIADLIVRLGTFQHHFEGLSTDAIRQRVGNHLNLCLADDSHTVLVAVTEPDRIVGYVAVHWLPYLFMPGPEGFVSELFIEDTARAQGIGTQLLESVKQEAQARGCARLSLINLRDRESYQRGFYAKLGWQERPDAANFIYRLSRS
jgi:GNAT superfamily N-acetyltransferase